MRKLKNCLVLFLVITMVFSLGACGRKTPKGYYIDGSEITDLDDIENQGTASGDETTTSVGNASSGTASGGKTSGSGNTASTVTTDRTQKSIWKIKKSCLKNGEMDINTEKL